MQDRLLSRPNQSFFLFGPRGVGKTTWLNHHFRGSRYFDLLSSKLYLQLSRNHNHLEALIGNQPAETWVLIDEIQKIPSLLDEVHRLIETKQFRFGLTGSSARKLKKEGANLLGGRALTRNLFPLTYAEWPETFQLQRAVEWGGLPLSFKADSPADFLESYLHTYLKEEIKEEGLVRQIEPFVRFLEIAAQMNAQTLNVESVARDAFVKRVTVDNWFSILEDTLIGYRLPAWRPGFKVRETAHPKFYWFDPGVARAAAGRLYETADSAWLGWSLETFLLGQVRAYSHYSKKNKNLFYYALPSDLDIDLIIELKKSTLGRGGEIIGVEFKSSTRWRREWEGPLRDLKKNKNTTIRNMIGVYQGSEKLTFDDFTVLPVQDFLDLLFVGGIF